MWRNSTESAVSGTQYDDLTLVHASQHGDVAAFGELVQRYDRKLFRIAHQVTQSPQDAEEVVQDAFLKAFQHLSRFRGDSKFSTWLVRITLNQALMRLRQRRLRREFSLENNPHPEEGNLPFDLADWAPNPEQLYKAAELKAILRKALRALTPASKIVFVLRDIEGLSLEETAEALGLSVGSVKARCWRARMQLRERLSKYFQEPKGIGVSEAPSSRVAAKVLTSPAYVPASLISVHRGSHPVDCVSFSLRPRRCFREKVFSAFEELDGAGAELKRKPCHLPVKKLFTTARNHAIAACRPCLGCSRN